MTAGVPTAHETPALVINRVGGATAKKPATCREKANKIKNAKKRKQALRRCPKPKPKKTSKTKRPSARSTIGRQ